MESLPPVKLGAIIASGFLPLLLFRQPLLRRLVTRLPEVRQPGRVLWLDLAICAAAGVLVSTFNYIVYSFTLSSAFALLVGYILIGVFISIDTSLAWERRIIQQAIDEKTVYPIQKNFLPITRKFTIVAIALTVLISLVLILIFSRDIMWLVQTDDDAASILSAQRSVTAEIFFIMTVLTVLIVNVIFTYSKNLKLLFQNQTRILEQVTRGDLSDKVPVATHDEFGFIANHTNEMIDGLRHRLELMSSLQLAREVQQTLLPRANPDIAGFEISGTSRYCEQTGGDYYDYLELPGDRLGIVVADVCGHGLSAALLMMSVRAFLRSSLPDYQNPEELIVATNHSLYEDCHPSGQFASLFFLEITPASKTLRWLRAGHEPPVLYRRASDSCERLEGPGLVLGVEAEPHFAGQDGLHMAHSDILLIGTDGLFEARNSGGEMFGYQRTCALLRQNREKTASEIQEIIIESLEQFCGGQNRDDDITLVLVKAA